MADEVGDEEVAELAALTDPVRVRRARESHRLTQRDLARILTDEGHRISAPALSQIERGVTRPSPDTLAALAVVLDHPVSFFARRSSPRTSVDSREPASYFRSLRSTSARDRRHALSSAHLVHDFVLAVERHVRLPTVDRPLVETTDPAAAAAATRNAWGIGAGPIPDVVREMEHRGFVVVRLAGAGEKVDAFSVNFPDRPVVVLAAPKGKRDRSRFDASHELGHLVLDHDPDDDGRDVEAEAHAFAAAFLMPAEEIEPELRAERLSWGYLLQLKLRWGTSIAALVRRARDLHVISGSQYTNFMKAISARGWRKDEPGDRDLGPPEAPALLDAVVDYFGGRRVDLESITADAALPLNPLWEIIEASRDPRPRLEL